MLRNVTCIVLLSSVALICAHQSERVLDRFVDRMFDEAFKALPVAPTDFNTATLAKPGNPGIHPGSNSNLAGRMASRNYAQFANTIHHFPNHGARMHHRNPVQRYHANAEPHAKIMAATTEATQTVKSDPVKYDPVKYKRPIYKGVKQLTSLGPITFAAEKIMQLFLAGADVFRLNLSHGREEKGDVIKTIRGVEAEVGYPIGVLADLQGPKQRCGMFKDDSKFELKEGDHFRFDLNPEEGDAKRVQLPHPEIIEALSAGRTLLIDDGKMVMKVISSGKDFVECEVTVGGIISSRKGVNTPDVELPISPITEKDKLDLNFILDFEPDFVALSFVQKADDMKQLRQMIAEHPCKHKPKIVAKIEKPVAIDNLNEIVEASDAIMVARGDLGVELGLEDVPVMQKQIIEQSRIQGKTVIMATQMLESMMEAPTPTRAECSDCAAAVFDGASAVMLSGESAAGKYPTESVDMQQKIIIRTEESDLFQKWQLDHQLVGTGEKSDSMVLAAEKLALSVNAKCIVVFTTSGSSADRTSRYHTGIPILAITPSLQVARSLTLNHHVYPAVLNGAWDDSSPRFSELVDKAVAIARDKGLVTKDTDTLVITGGLPFGVKGMVNVIRMVKAGGTNFWDEDA